MRVFFKMLNNALNLFVRNIGALQARGLCGPVRMKQHVAVAKQLFRAAHIQNNPAVERGVYRKCRAGGDVGLD